MTFHHYILDENDRVVVVDVMTWARWFESKKRIVKQEWIGDCQVSTVFLGLDYNFVGKGAPILWETMVFSNRKNMNWEMRRCTGNREQAEAMHEQMVKRVCEAERVEYAAIRA